MVRNKVIITGRVNYFIDGQMFENDKGKHNGHDKALEYCYEKRLDPNDIIKFDSRTECKRYEFLKARQEKGEIRELKHHFVFRIRGEEENCIGDKYPIKTYNSDFYYFDVLRNRYIVEDVKGTEYFISDEFIDTKRDFDMTFKGENLYIAIMLLNKVSGEWYEYHIGDEKKHQKLIKKQRAEIKELRAEKHEREIADNKANREKARLKELSEKEKLNSTERKRYEELKDKYRI